MSSPLKVVRHAQTRVQIFVLFIKLNFFSFLLIIYVQIRTYIINFYQFERKHKLFP